MKLSDKYGGIQFFGAEVPPDDGPPDTPPAVLGIIVFDTDGMVMYQNNQGLNDFYYRSSPISGIYDDEYTLVYDLSDYDGISYGIGGNPIVDGTNITNNTVQLIPKSQNAGGN